MANLIDEHTKIRVSSVLNRDTTNFGKKHLIDGNGDTCWNSDQGTPQWVCLDFNNPVVPSEVQLQFQGGFAGKEVKVEAVDAISDTTTRTDIFPEDNNALQTFPLQLDTPIKRLRIVFRTGTDMFGRIVLYHLALIGKNRQ
uniref:Nuclear receptor 2C2-associated protein n=1 Tax=Amblyomma tuberculatum TaxID=48802 RepID=A0A6M2E3G9_9ACAR